MVEIDGLRFPANLPDPIPPVESLPEWVRHIGWKLWDDRCKAAGRYDLYRKRQKAWGKQMRATGYGIPRGNGYPKEARWFAMSEIGEFPKPANTPEVAEERAFAALVAAGDYIADMTWAFNNLDNGIITKRDAPTRAAWTILRLGRADPATLRKQYHDALCPSQSAIDKEGLRREGAKAAVEVLDTFLNSYSEAKQPEVPAFIQEGALA